MKLCSKGKIFAVFLYQLVRILCLLEAVHVTIVAICVLCGLDEKDNNKTLIYKRKKFSLQNKQFFYIYNNYYCITINRKFSTHNIKKRNDHDKLQYLIFFIF